MITKIGAPIKTTLLTALITAPIILNGCANQNKGNSSRTSEPKITTVSKSTANALKSNAVNTPGYSQARTKRIDDKVRSYATDSKDLRETNKNLDELYKNLGTFGATADMQQYIDQEALRAVLKKFHDNYYDSDKEMLDAFANKNDLPSIGSIVGYLDGGLSRKYIDIVDKEEDNNLYKGNIPSFDEVSNFYDVVFKKFKFTEKEMQDYKNSINQFKSKQKDKSSVQAKSDLIAYKIYTMDRIAFQEYFKLLHEQVSEFIPDRKYQKFLKYFNEFLINANPEKY